MSKQYTPVWPLPCDWKWAGGATPPNKIGDPKSNKQCPHCLQWLSLVPNDAKDSYRRHVGGMKCHKGREVVAMNREGFHLMSTSGIGFWTEALRPVMRSGKFFRFFPAPIVSFIRWKLANDRRVRKDKEFLKELEQFMALTEEQQVAQLEGAILEWEFRWETQTSYKK